MMDRMLRILIAEDTEDDALLLIRALRQGGFTPDATRIWTEEGLRSALEGSAWDIILSDYHMPGFGGDRVIDITREKGFDTPIIIVSGAIGEEAAVSLMKCGADDYVMKDNLVRLSTSVSRALKEAEDRVERRRAEEALLDSEERYRSLVQQISEGILIINGETGEIIESNEKICDILRYTNKELHSMTIEEIGGGLLLQKRGRAIEEVFERRDGQTIDLEISINPISIKGYKKVVCAVIRDITEQKELERHQVKAFLQIDKNIEQFAILADHIRNPLQVIMGYSLLSEDPTAQEILQQVDRINDIIKRLDHGWIDSENVRRFLRRNYGIGEESPGLNQ
ncbi:MAG: PAS domain S-box protein [Methanocalculus sp.]|uniref:PAS domain S-box protein n=1 Tax=Methanocalculus sp. TaxID=2004547 RepID=UPI002719DEB9|nr:PAS domain S-box protein [Methanocalculus sp.]MDO9539749.1 PAS domain S-box protein [Methanocalculus sp.]